MKNSMLSKLNNLPFAFRLATPPRTTGLWMTMIPLSPLLILTAFSFRGSEHSTYLGLKYSCCLNAIHSAIHPGMQVATFGAPLTSLTLHPMFALKRFLLPCLPLCVSGLALHACLDQSSLTCRYVVYATLFNMAFDFIGRVFGTSPRWFYFSQLGFGFLNLFCLSVLSSSPTLIPPNLVDS